MKKLSRDHFETNKHQVHITLHLKDSAPLKGKMAVV